MKNVKYFSFKPGDKLRCIKGTPLLRVGFVYTFLGLTTSSEGGLGVRVLELPEKAYKLKRFERVGGSNA